MELRGDSMDIKKLIRSRVGIYEMKVEALQERLLVMPEESESRESFERELKELYWRDEELLELLSEISKVEEKERVGALKDMSPKVLRKE